MRTLQQSAVRIASAAMMGFLAVCPSSASEKAMWKQLSKADDAKIYKKLKQAHGHLEKAWEEHPWWGIRCKQAEIFAAERNVQRAIGSYSLCRTGASNHHHWVDVRAILKKNFMGRLTVQFADGFDTPTYKALERPLLEIDSEYDPFERCLALFQRGFALPEKGLAKLGEIKSCWAELEPDLGRLPQNEQSEFVSGMLGGLMGAFSNVRYDADTLSPVIEYITWARALPWWRASTISSTSTENLGCSFLSQFLSAYDPPPAQGTGTGVAAAKLDPFAVRHPLDAQLATALGQEASSPDLVATCGMTSEYAYFMAELHRAVGNHEIASAVGQVASQRATAELEAKKRQWAIEKQQREIDRAARERQQALERAEEEAEFQAELEARRQRDAQIMAIGMAFSQQQNEYSKQLLEAAKAQAAGQNVPVPPPPDPMAAYRAALSPPPPNQYVPPPPSPGNPVPAVPPPASWMAGVGIPPIPAATPPPVGAADTSYPAVLAPPVTPSGVGAKPGSQSSRPGPTACGASVFPKITEFSSYSWGKEYDVYFVVSVENCPMDRAEVWFNYRWVYAEQELNTYTPDPRGYHFMQEIKEYLSNTSLPYKTAHTPYDRSKATKASPQMETWDFVCKCWPPDPSPGQGVKN